VRTFLVREPRDLTVDQGGVSSLARIGKARSFNSGVAALVARLKQAGRLKPKQIVVAAMHKLLVICFGVLKPGKPFDPAVHASLSRG
jgi:hypothetical protein